MIVSLNDLYSELNKAGFSVERAGNGLYIHDNELRILQNKSGFDLVNKDGSAKSVSDVINALKSELASVKFGSLDSTLRRIKWYLGSDIRFKMHDEREILGDSRAFKLIGEFPSAMLFYNNGSLFLTSLINGSKRNVSSMRELQDAIS